MKVWSVRTAVLAFSTVFAMLGVACKQAPKQEEVARQQPAPKPAASVPEIKVTPTVQAKAKTPKPEKGATKKPPAETFGKGKASVNFKGSPHERSFWAEQLDIDNSGNPVLVDEAWDNRAKVLYLSNDRTFRCGNGQSATGSTLMAVYGKGNARKRPVGSGWWVSELNAGDCGVPVAGLYGCRFDAAGNNSDCGSATIQPEVNDIVIVPLPNSGSSTGDAGQTGSSMGSGGSSPSTGAGPGQQSPNN